MSFGLLKRPYALMISPIAAFFARHFKIDIPVNPPKIVLIEGDQFSIDMNEMETLRPYMMTFLDSRYMFWKNQKGALVLTEV